MCVKTLFPVKSGTHVTLIKAHTRLAKGHTLHFGFHLGKNSYGNKVFWVLNRSQLSRKPDLHLHGV